MLPSYSVSENWTTLASGRRWLKKTFFVVYRLYTVLYNLEKKTLKKVLFTHLLSDARAVQFSETLFHSNFFVENIFIKVILNHPEKIPTLHILLLRVDHSNY